MERIDAPIRDTGLFWILKFIPAVARSGCTSRNELSSPRISIFCPNNELSVFVIRK